jgi:hypothetical protein
MDAIRLERTGVLISQANLLMAMPVGALTSVTQDTTVYSENFQFDVQRTINLPDVTVTVTPPSATGVGPDSVKMSRGS